MATKEELYGLITAYGLGRVLPQGTTRAGISAFAKTAIRGGKIVAPVVGRAALSGARAYPGTALAAGLGTAGYGAYQAGLLDPAFEAVPTPQEFFDVVIPAVKKKAKTTKFNRAVAVGMSTVRKSTSYGKKGVINNAKRAFSTVTKTVSGVNRGKKIPKSGIKRKIALAVRGILK